MRIFGLPWGYIQGRASQIEILNVCLQCSIPWVLPESLKPIQGHLLNGPVVCIGRAGPAKSVNCSGMCGVRSVGEGIPFSLAIHSIPAEPAPACTIERLTSVPARIGRTT